MKPPKFNFALNEETNKGEMAVRVVPTIVLNCPKGPVIKIEVGKIKLQFDSSTSAANTEADHGWHDRVCKAGSMDVTRNSKVNVPTLIAAAAKNWDVFRKRKIAARANYKLTYQIAARGYIMTLLDQYAAQLRDQKAAFRSFSKIGSDGASHLPEPRVNTFFDHLGDGQIFAQDVSSCVAEASSSHLRFKDYDPKAPQKLKPLASSLLSLSEFDDVYTFAELLFSEVAVYSEHYLKYRSEDKTIDHWKKKFVKKDYWKEDESTALYYDYLRSRYRSLAARDLVDHAAMFILLNPYGDFWTKTYNSNMQLALDRDIEGLLYKKLVLNDYVATPSYIDQPLSVYAFEALLDYNAFLPFILGKLGNINDGPENLSPADAVIEKSDSNPGKDAIFESAVKCLVSKAQNKIEQLPNRTDFLMSKARALYIFRSSNLKQLTKVIVD